MSVIDDQILSAYLDGELDSETTAKVEAEIRSEKTVALRVAQLRALEANLGSAFSSSMSEPAPERFAKILAARPRKPGHLRIPSVSDFLRPIVLAPAGASLAAGALLGFLSTTTLTSAEAVMASVDGQMVLTGHAARAVSRARSGVAETDGGQEVLVRLSFADNSGRFCRHVSIENNDAVVCNNSGRWVVETLAPGPGIGAQGYQTAASNAPGEVAATLARLGVAEPLDAGQEDALIRSGWKKSGP